MKDIILTLNLDSEFWEVDEEKKSGTSSVSQDDGKSNQVINFGIRARGWRLIWFSTRFSFGQVLQLYFLYKLGVFHCIFRTSFKMIRGCFSMVFSFWEHACRWLCHVLSSVDNRHRRRRCKRDIEMAEIISSRSDEEDTEMDTSVSHHGEAYRSRRRMWLRDHIRNHMRKSLRVRSHQVRVCVDSGDSVYVTKRKHIRHGDVRVIRTSSFAKKRSSHKKSRRLHNKT